MSNRTREGVGLVSRHRQKLEELAQGDPETAQSIRLAVGPGGSDWAKGTSTTTPINVIKKNAGPNRLICLAIPGAPNQVHQQ